MNLSSEVLERQRATVYGLIAEFPGIKTFTLERVCRFKVAPHINVGLAGRWIRRTPNGGFEVTALGANQLELYKQDRGDPVGQLRHEVQLLLEARGAV
jgi:hypothetical protein